MKYTVPWWGSLGLSFLIALMLVGDRPLSLFGVLLLWPFVAFVLHCIMGYWQTQEDAEQRRLRNSGLLVEGPPPDHEHLRCPQCGSAKVGWSQEYERIFCWYCRPVESPIEEAADDEPFRCPTCGSTNAKRLSDLETVCYDCRPVVHTSQDDEELRALLRQLQPTKELSRDDDYTGRSLPQLRLEDIKDSPPLSHDELMDSVLKFHKSKKH